MKRLKKDTIRFLLIALALVVTDLIVKSFVVKRLEVGETIKIVDNYFFVARIPNLKMAWGWKWQSGLNIIDVLGIIIQVLILLIAVRIQKMNINRLYKISSVLLVFGWIGNYLDKILFSQGDPSYIHTDYIHFWPFDFFTSLSTSMISVGWILLIVSIAIGFKDLKIIFSKARTNN